MSASVETQSQDSACVTPHRIARLSGHVLSELAFPLDREVLRCSFILPDEGGAYRCVSHEIRAGNDRPGAVAIVGDASRLDIEPQPSQYSRREDRIHHSRFVPGP